MPNRFKQIMLNYNPYAKKKRPHPDSTSQRPVTQNVMKVKAPPASYSSSSGGESSNGISTSSTTYNANEYTGNDNVLGNKATILMPQESSSKRLLPQTMRINPYHQHQHQEAAKHPYPPSKAIDLTSNSSDEEQTSRQKTIENPYQKTNPGYSPSFSNQQQNIPPRTINPYKKSSPAIQSTVGDTTKCNSIRKALANPLGSKAHAAKNLCQVHPASPSSITTKPVVKPTPTQQKIVHQPQSQRHNKLQSIRPPTWNSKTNQAKLVSNTTATTTTTTAAAATINTMNTALSTQVQSSQTNKKATIELPGEAPLPREISYSSDDVKAVNDEYRKDLVINANLTKPLLNGWTLYPHQKRAILQGIVKRRMILALDMGLGKTLIGCVWAKAFKKTFDCLKILVICPVSLKAEWKRTAENTSGLRVEDEKERNSRSMDLRICSWAKVPKGVESCVDNFVCIFDEAHSMQSMTASRTKDALQLVSDKRYAWCILSIYVMRFLL